MGGGGPLSGYIEAGYVIVLGSLALYSASVVTRERAARRRVTRTAEDESRQLPVDRGRGDDTTAGGEP